MYSIENRVRYSETDSSGNLSLTALVDYFQDVTIFHSTDVGFSVEFMREKQMVWVLSAWQIIIRKMPRYGEKVRVVTAPYDFKVFVGSRNFGLYGMDGEEYAVANSLWSLISLETGRPVSPSADMVEKYGIEPPLEMEYAPRKIIVPKEGGEKKEPIVVKSYHLDTNKHVNNKQYIQMAQDFLPENFKIGQLRAEYKRQAFLNDVMVPVVVTDGNRVVVSLETEDAKPYVIVEFTQA